jgi:hypothetical protein
MNLILFAANVSQNKNKWSGRQMKQKYGI